MSFRFRFINVKAKARQKVYIVVFRLMPSKIEQVRRTTFSQTYDPEASNKLRKFSAPCAILYTTTSYVENEMKEIATSFRE